MEYAQLMSISTVWLVDNALNVLTALIVLGVGWFLAGFVSHHVRQLLPRTRRIDETIAPILSQIVRYAIIVITVVIVLGQFGVQTASILAVLGAVGLAIAGPKASSTGSAMAMNARVCSSASNMRWSRNSSP